MTLPVKKHHTDEDQKKGNFILLRVGIFLINIIFFTLVVATCLFVIKVPVTSLHIFGAFLISVAVDYFFLGKSIKKTLLVSVLGAVILCVSVMMCMHIYDWSYDGNGYHKCITGFLKSGWNPLYETFYEFGADHFPFASDLVATWYDAYPKGSELWAACVNAACGDIEGGKSFNLISILGVFLVCAELLGQTGKLTHTQSFLCALFCVLNPVSLIQCFTYYNDGFLWRMVFLCFAALLYLTFYETGPYARLCVYLIFSSIAIGFNIKFSGVLFFAILCFTFFIFWCAGRIKRDGFTASTKKFILNRFCMFAVSVIFATAGIGSTSYVVNTIRYRNPVYTLIGEGKTDLIEGQMPPALQPMSNLKRFIASFFSQTNNSFTLEQVEWKWPFLFDADEFTAVQGYDTRLAGWGFLFSGICLLSAACICFGLYKYWNKYPKAVKLTVVLLFIYAFSIIAVPGMSWARHNQAICYIPVAALIYCFCNSKKSVKSAYLAGGMVTLLLINMVPNLVKIIEQWDRYEIIEAKFDYMSQLSKDNSFSLGFADRYSMYGYLFNVVDRGIDYVYQKNFDSGVNTLSLNALAYEIISGPMCTRNGPMSSKTAEEFLDYAGKPDVLTLIAVKDEGSNALNDAIINKMKSFGLEFDLKGNFRYSYLAVLDGKDVVCEDISKESLSYSGTIDGAELSLGSGGHWAGNSASVKINGMETALNRRGLNIVLFDKKTQKVTASVSIDSCVDNKLYIDLP